MSARRGTAAAIAASSSTRKPVLPSTISSGAAPSSKAITGVPHASASTMTIPNGSCQRIGISSPLAREKRERFLAPPISPAKRTLSPSIWGATSWSKKAC